MSDRRIRTRVHEIIHGEKINPRGRRTRDYYYIVYTLRHRLPHRVRRGTGFFYYHGRFFFRFVPTDINRQSNLPTEHRTMSLAHKKYITRGWYDKVCAWRPPSPPSRVSHVIEPSKRPVDNIYVYICARARNRRTTETENRNWSFYIVIIVFWKRANLTAVKQTRLFNKSLASGCIITIHRQFAFVITRVRARTRGMCHTVYWYIYIRRKRVPLYSIIIFAPRSVSSAHSYTCVCVCKSPFSSHHQLFYRIFLKFKYFQDSRSIVILGFR